MSVGPLLWVDQLDIIFQSRVRRMISPDDQPVSMRGLFVGSALLGVILGLGLELAFVPREFPRAILGADPADLRLDIKDDYIRMIAATYSLDGDTTHALQRLSALRLPNPSSSVASLVQREPSGPTAQALVRLGAAVREPSVSLLQPTFTPRPSRYRSAGEADRSNATLTYTLPAPEAATPLPKAGATEEPSESGVPDLTPTPNAQAPHFYLKAKSPMNCFRVSDSAIIQIQVQDAKGNPEPGIGVEIASEDGAQRLFTGLKPEYGIGYASSLVSPGVYEVQLTGTGSSIDVRNLIIDENPDPCTSHSTEVRGWRLVFRRTAE